MATNQDKRISATLAASTYEALEKLAEAKGESMADALRDAIALSKWFKDTQDNGDKVLVESHGELREVFRL